QLSKLREMLHNMGASTAAAESLQRSHVELGQRYRDALRSYDQTKADSAHVVDKMVKGMDRPVTDAFDTLVAQVVDTAGKTMEDLERTSSAEAAALRNWAMIVLFLAISISTILAWVTVRHVRRELAGAA